MKRVAVILLSMACSMVFAQGPTYEVTITNITKGQIFSPPVVIAHGDDYQMFSLGEAASDALATMAEDGMAEPLATEAAGHDAVSGTAVSEGPVMPGQSVTLEVQADYGTNYISVAGMLVTTNDAFFAVNGLRAPFSFGKRGSAFSQMAYADAYDAGSEANTEDCANIPGPPCGNGGVRVTEGAEGFIHLHSGIHGHGTLSASDYDWRSKVAVVKVRLVR